MSSSGTSIWLGSSSGTLVPATLVSGLAERHLTHWHEHWRPARDAALAKRRAAHAKPPEHAHWNWEVLLRNRSGLLAYAGYAVECDDMTQGLILLDLTGTARLPSQVGKPLVLVEYLETAPWNNPDFQQPKRFGGVGTHLMRAAFERSIDEGFRGRIGLKSLPQAPGGHLKLPHLWPGQTPSPREGGTRVRGCYAVDARFATRAAASFSRQLLPSNFSRCPWWSRRSSNGVTTTVSPSRRAQSSTGRLLVTMVDARS